MIGPAGGAGVARREGRGRRRCKHPKEGGKGKERKKGGGGGEGRGGKKCTRLTSASVSCFAGGKLVLVQARMLARRDGVRDFHSSNASTCSRCSSCAAPCAGFRLGGRFEMSFGRRAGGGIRLLREPSRLTAIGMARQGFLPMRIGARGRCGLHHWPLLALRPLTRFLGLWADCAAVSLLLFQTGHAPPVLACAVAGPVGLATEEKPRSTAVDPLRYPNGKSAPAGDARPCYTAMLEP